MLSFFWLITNWGGGDYQLKSACHKRHLCGGDYSLRNSGLPPPSSNNFMVLMLLFKPLFCFVIEKFFKEFELHFGTSRCKTAIFGTLCWVVGLFILNTYQNGWTVQDNTLFWQTWAQFMAGRNSRDFSRNILIWKHFSKSTRDYRKFRKILQ